MQIENLLDRQIEYAGNIPGQLEGRIVLAFFEKNDGLPPHPRQFRQSVLCQSVASPQLFNPVLNRHFQHQRC